MTDAPSSHPYLAATSWPAEDGGPARLARPHGLPGPQARNGQLAAVRQAPLSLMMLHAPGGRLLVLRASMPPDTLSWVECIDPITLDEAERSPDLATGPFWPGGMGVLADGAVIVVQGRWVHRLGTDLSIEVSRSLPVDAPYNSFVVLGDGSLAMKDLQMPDGSASTLSILDPVMLEDRCEPLVLPEPSVARLAALDNEVFVVGVTALHRVIWSRANHQAELQHHLRAEYLIYDDQSYGWDPVIEAGAVWWMDNGDHTFIDGLTMLGNGVSTGPTRLWKAPLDGSPPMSVETSGLPEGAVTNPPLVDADRGLAVSFDSANGVLAAFDVDDLRPRWRTDINTAQHLWFFAETGEIIANDHDPDAGDALAVVNLDNGAIKARIPVDSPAQSVVFGAPGPNNDAYYVSLMTIARVVFED